MLRWGTEPEGWHVDLPYAVFLVGVNYSPLESRQLIVSPSFCQSLKWMTLFIASIGNPQAARPLRLMTTFQCSGHSSLVSKFKIVNINSVGW
jgi:hypothetical protein